MRFGTQLDLQGVIPEHADQAVRYLAKYLTKAIGETHTDGDRPGLRAAPRPAARRTALAALLARCANWLRYGVQPDHAKPGLIPGQCRMRAHDRDNLGVTRRVLPSRLWSGKTVDQHKADRAEVVRQTLLSAGMDDLDLDRMAATVTLPDGSPRFAWTDMRPDHDTYVRIVLDSIGERQRWRAQYEARQDRCALQEFRQLPSRPDPPGLTAARPHPMTGPHLVGGTAVRGERSESRSDGDSRP